MKKVWLINQYAMPPELEPRIRTIKLAHYLKQKGYDVTVFASSFLHNTNINLIEDNTPYIEKYYDDLRFVHIRMNQYKKNGIKRILSLIVFPLKLLRYYKRFEKPDIIVQLATVPWGNIISRIAKKTKAKYIVEVVDLWPESFVAFGLVKKNNPFLKLAYRAERRLYEKADKLVFSMEGGRQYIKDKKWDTKNGGSIDIEKVHHINNGVDLKDFDSYKDKFKIDDMDLTDDSTYKIVYIGSIRYANNVKLLVDAALLLKDQKDIKFFIYGDGGQREELENYCRENNATNIIFKQKWVEPKYVPYILSNSSLNVLNYKFNEIWRYGGSQSKFFQYLAAGKPICSNVDMGSYCLINRHNLGVSESFENPEEYAAAIMSIRNMSVEDHSSMCARVRSLASEFDYEKLTEHLIQIF